MRQETGPEVQYIGKRLVQRQYRGRIRIQRYSTEITDWFRDTEQRPKIGSEIQCRDMRLYQRYSYNTQTRD